MDAFLILMVLGLVAYGRNVRGGILGAIFSLNASGQIVAVNTPANPNAVQGPGAGGAGDIPNSNGFNTSGSGPAFSQTGSPAPVDMYSPGFVPGSYGLESYSPPSSGISNHPEEGTPVPGLPGVFSFTFTPPSGGS